MTQIEIEDLVKKLVAQQQFSGIDFTDVKREHVFTGDFLCFDSLDVVELLMEVEDQFDICIPDEEAEKHFRSVGSVIDYVKTRIE